MGSMSPASKSLNSYELLVIGGGGSRNLAMNFKFTEFITEAIDNRSNYSWLIVDANFIIRYVNKTFCRWVKKQSADMLGKSLFDVFYQGKEPNYMGNYNYPLIQTVKLNLG